jgi:predicted site-specific integrase-resolvase
MEQEYFTPREVALRLRVDYATVMRWIRTGLLDAETIQEGRRNRHRIRKVVLETLEAPRQPSTTITTS